MGAKADPSDMHAHPQRRRPSDDNCSTILGGLLSLVLLVFLYRWIDDTSVNRTTSPSCTQTDLLYNEHTQRVIIDMTGIEGITIDIEKDGDEREDGLLLDGVSNQLIQLSTLPHKLLPTPDPDSSRLIIIGDVHGQLHELQTLLEAAGFSRKRGDHVVFTGDMISKGPDSPGVVDFAMEIGASGVRGNHEDRVLTAWRKMHKHRTLDTLTLDDQVEEEEEEDGDVDAASKKKADRAVAQSLTPTQRKWLSRLPVILKVGHIPFHGEVVVVHAGLVPYVPLEDQDPDAVMNMRTLLFEKDRAASPTGKHKKDHHHEKNRIATPSEGREGKSWSKVWNKVQEDLPEKKRMTVVYGHDAKTGLNVQEYTFGLDSGCVRGKELTALVFAPDEKGGIKHEIVSVDCEKPKKDKKKKKHHKAKADDADGEDGVEEEDGEGVIDEMR